MDSMKLYKFRPLAEVKDFERAKTILNTGIFWCSKFLELNDPMEGVFYIRNKNVDGIYNEKNKYRICSFSDEAAFENPCMWGYYANGFKGIAIEIEVDKGKVKKIDYKDDIDNINGSKPDAIEAILTTKLASWNHEVEYRFLKKSEENEHPNEHLIGKITAVYFGEPHSDIVNRQTVYEENKKLQCYQCLRNKLITIAQDNKMKCFSVKIENSKVKKDVEINPDSTA